MAKVCPDCGVVVGNIRKHKARNRCTKQHIRKEIKETLKMTEPYKNYNIPEPYPKDFPEEPEEPDIDDEEYMIPTYRGVKENKNEDS